MPPKLKRLALKQLKNQFFELTYVPDFGCHWTRLKIKSGGEWMDLLYPVEDPEELRGQPTSLGSYIMAPWANRIPNGVFEFKKKRHQILPNFPDQTAIHGDVRRRPWKVQSSTSAHVKAVLDSRDFEDFNFPFALQFIYEIVLSENKLRTTLMIQNLSDEPAPVGMGHHPFFKRRLTGQDQDVKLILPAEKVYSAESSFIKGEAKPVAEKFDLRKDGFLGNPDLDDCYTCLSSDTVQLIYAGSGVKVDLKVEPVFGHFVVYAPKWDDGSERPYFAVEPQTHVTNGFNFYEQGWKNTGVKELKPGEKWGGFFDLLIHTM
ncbi:MAG: hypothetical protein A3G33_00215 [Omnitrophica bacterium RIFCSPLOWO2_12_FULL_44_17]|uniref:Aldose epimerase n=1 Tax=Candidatus Danuiimicrobium aquiferis TaxID=1801832 RepID=A0A1G1L104_9BACT|nr:MAG: hypothetical protein A3B72_10225 [Omnitrophica bacterium RIFCSPHIGHO2_02_FULL_45_28]OGW90771.1 MAG: hypothetical protein A3E74_05475 [Omnitrophica bacterium RIFCSPHIGHO2_12_FULL_44_12]OGW98822.1 MAG: hypothetical protein A3G33_00215 [Omnitrophica bacterium RIFCSPLOWO2_12_FULL_44_17]OGX02860.1 MAG: hypothetical protein A3J12_01610 [Omnitrophica bacterium RIFCSPLOWO2_02_FULL_44_11]